MMYPWHETQWQLLQAQYRRQAVHHALLFVGPSGLGKLDCAKSFIQLLLCSQVSADSSIACGQCQSCHWYKEGSHPDYFNLTLQDKAKTIKVEQIRQLKEALSQTSHQSGYQTVLVQPADALSQASANALLKTLEEPSGKVVFILVTDHKDRLPATIISRCQMIPFRMDQLDLAKQWLQQQPDIDSASIDVLLRAAHGSPLLALEYASCDYQQTRDALLLQLQKLSQNQLDPVVVAVAMAKQDVVLLLAIFIALLSDMLKQYLQVADNHAIYQDCLPQLQQFSAQISLAKLFRCFEVASQTRALLQGNTGINVQLALESILIDWIGLTAN